jgi:Tol biopolymer transport system component
VSGKVTNGSRSSDLWIVPIDGSPPRQTAFSRVSIASLAIHPDGRRFAFSAGTSGADEVWVMDSFLPTAAGALKEPQAKKR